MQHKQSGFTLIELLVTLAIAGILMSVAIPNYQTFVLNSRISTQANDLMGSIGLARSEAIKRAARVSLCKSANGTGCTTTGTWAQGWIVFTDSGVVGDYDGSDAVIQVRGALEGGSTLVGNTGLANYFAYGASGIGAVAGTISLCPRSPAQVVGRDIVITNSGRPSVKKPPATACV